MTHPLWAPWRMDYILGPKPDSCVLCLPPDDLSHDEERLVLYRGKTAFVIMNKFPYNNGHIMVAPLRHVMDLPLLAAEESTEIMELLKQCTTSAKPPERASATTCISISSPAGMAILRSWP